VAEANGTGVRHAVSELHQSRMRLHVPAGRRSGVGLLAVGLVTGVVLTITALSVMRDGHVPRQLRASDDDLAHLRHHSHHSHRHDVTRTGDVKVVDLTEQDKHKHTGTACHVSRCVVCPPATIGPVGQMASSLHGLCGCFWHKVFCDDLLFVFVAFETFQHIQFARHITTEQHIARSLLLALPVCYTEKECCMGNCRQMKCSFNVITSC